MHGAVKKWIALLFAAGIAAGGFPLCYARAEEKTGKETGTTVVYFELAETPTPDPEPISIAATDEQTEASATPEPSAAPDETPTPAPAVTAAPTPSVSPTPTPTPTAAPTRSPAVSESPAPEAETTADPATLVSAYVKIEGPASLARGCSVTYIAKVLPSTAIDRTVVWSLREDVEPEEEAAEETPVPEDTETDAAEVPAAADTGELPDETPTPSPTPTPELFTALQGVTIDETGLVTAQIDAAAESVVVVAVASDGSGAYAEWKLTLTDRNARKVIVRSDDRKAQTENGKPLSAVTMFTSALSNSAFDTPSKDNDETRLQLYACAEDGKTRLNAPRWESSNEDVVTVDENGLVAAVGAGKASVTCFAGDGGSASGQIMLHVYQPPQRIALEIIDAVMLDGTAALTFGSNMRIAATAYLESGEVCNTPISFDYAVFSFDAGGNYVDDVTARFKRDKLVAVSDFGTLRISPTLADVWERDTVNYSMWLTAKAGDGSGVAQTLPVSLGPATTFMTAAGSENVTVNVGETAALRFVSDAYQISFSAKAEMRKLVSVVGDFYEDEYPYTAIKIKGLAPGESKITIRPCDGSKVSLTYHVTVLAPPESQSTTAD